MSARERCHNCDHPLATEADHNARGCDRCARFDATCPHASLCWSAFAMPCPPVDWRARALAAEAERDEVRRRAREAAQTIIEAIGADGPQNVEEAAVRVVVKLEATEAERDMLRGVGCDEVDGGELRGPCGACLKCARRERGDARALLAAAARGELRRCETCGERLATRRWRGTDVDVCDRCFDEDKRDAADGWETLDEEACEDLPHAAALRAAMEAAK